MKLDLLYEVDAPKPWTGGSHPLGQRRAEQRAYREALEQIRLADGVCATPSINMSIAPSPLACTKTGTPRSIRLAILGLNLPEG